MVPNQVETKNEKVFFAASKKFLRKFAGWTPPPCCRRATGARTRLCPPKHNRIPCAVLLTPPLPPNHAPYPMHLPACCLPVCQSSQAAACRRPQQHKPAAAGAHYYYYELVQKWSCNNRIEGSFLRQRSPPLLLFLSATSCCCPVGGHHHRCAINYKS